MYLHASDKQYVERKLHSGIKLALVSASWPEKTPTWHYGEITSEQQGEAGIPTKGRHEPRLAAG